MAKLPNFAFHVQYWGHLREVPLLIAVPAGARIRGFSPATRLETCSRKEHENASMCPG